MPSTTTSPVKILSDLGYEMVDLESQEDYLSALMEGAGAIEAATKGKGDGRSAILREEVIRVRKERKAANPSPGMKVTQKKITGEAFKKGSSVGRAENVAADTTGASAIQKWQPPGAIQQADDISKDSSPLASPGLLNAVQAIAGSVDNIVGILKDQADAQKDAAEDARVAAEEKEGKQREKGLETKIFSGLKKTGEKIMKPIKSLWDKLINFFTTVFLGRAFVKIIEWFSDPANKEKITSLFKFLKDWWPAIVAALIAFASPLLGPVGVIAGVVALLMWGVPKVLDAAGYIGSLVGKVFSFLKGGPDGDNKVDTKTTPSGKTRQEARQGTPDKSESTNKLEQGEGQQQQQDVNQPQQPAAKMASGGEVPGSGDKDTVPAMLTPGEFVMSKGAVKKWGVGTLKGMNAAGGGTNIPTLKTRETSEETNVSRGNSIGIKDKTNSMRPGHPLTVVKHGAEKVRTHFTTEKSPKKEYRGGGLVNKPMIVKRYSGGGLVNNPMIVKGYSGGGEVSEDSGATVIELASSQQAPGEISPPVSGGIRMMQAEGAAEDAKAKSSTPPGSPIPEFSADTMVSPYKIKTLGITV